MRIMDIEFPTTSGEPRKCRVRPGMVGVGVVVEDEETGEKVVSVDFQPVGYIEVHLYGNAYPVKVTP